MDSKNNVFNQTLEKLAIDPALKMTLKEAYSTMERDTQRATFRFNRTMKDKSIMVNLLNKTIGDLQDNQQQLEELNKSLLEKNKEIALKNFELTRQKELLEEQSKELETNLHKLELSYGELEQFSYVASHDLKSPLRAISSYAQLLRRRYAGKLDKDADSFIDFIVQGVLSMDNILSDLLVYSRTGKKLYYKRLDIQNLFEQAKQNLQFEIVEQNARIECAELPDLVVSESGIVQLFQNLLANAIKFRHNLNPHIVVQVTEKETEVQFTIEDNGIGLNPEYADKVFQPFQRINPNDFAGTGMGLAICQKIVKMHHGTIWYEPSKILGGTAFHFTLSKNLSES